MIKLFPSTATKFDSLGIGCLSDATKAVVVEERNGSFELELEYPVDGIHYSEIELRSLIVCKSTPFSNMQAFRVYAISKPINGIVTINAAHLSYDLSGIVVKPFTAATPVEALRGIKNNSTSNNPFTFGSINTISLDRGFKSDMPKTARSLLGGSEESILDTYKQGEYYFDNYFVDLMKNRGKDKGAIIKYGKNLTNIKHDEDETNVYTGVYPFWYGQVEKTDPGSGSAYYADELVTLDGDGIMRFEEGPDYDKILLLDLSNDFTDDAPTKEELEARAGQYINSNNLKNPKISTTISFINLFESQEYEYLQMLETIELCDTVTIQFPKLGVDVKAKCISTKYNAVTDKYIEIELGDTRSSFVKTVAQNSEEIEDIPTSNIIERSIERATQLITGGLGGYVILHNSSGKIGTPDELLVLDPDSGGDYKKAKGVWRFNSGGLGFSSNGYNGPFGLALTNDGQIVASKITTGILNIGGAGMAAGVNVYGPNPAGTEEVLKVSLNSKGIQLLNGTQIKWGDINKEGMPDFISETSIAGNYKGVTTIYYGVLFDGHTNTLEPDHTLPSQPNPSTTITEGKVWHAWCTVCPDVPEDLETRTDSRGNVYDNKYRYSTRFYACVRYTRYDSNYEFGPMYEMDNALATTVITKNTITTSYVNALQITAKSVRCEDLTGTTITGKVIKSSSFYTSNGNLHIYGTGSGNTAGIHMVEYENGSGWEFDIGSQTFFCRFYEDGREAAYAGYYVYQWIKGALGESDRRIKENIKPLSMELSKALIDGSEPKEFNYIRNKHRQSFGMIAQEVDELLTNIGYDKPNDLVDKPTDPDRTWLLEYKQYIPHLINYVQDLRHEVNLLKEEVNKLKEGDDKR